MAWVDIFSAGTKTSRQGVTQDFPLSRLASTVEAFEPKKFRPPLIVRHDTKGVPDSEIANQAFCYGVPEALRLVGDKLQANFKKIAPEFREWVKNGNLISVSSSFYAEDDPRNPTPGKLALRHVAALGADLPSDKNLGGLDPLLEYTEEDANADEFEFQMDSSWLQEFEESGAREQIKTIVAEAVQPISQRLDVLAKSAEAVATNPPQELEYMDWDDLVSWAIRLGVRQSGKATADIAAAADITPERLDVILGKSGEATYEEIQKIVQALGLDLEYSEPSPRELAMRQREADLAKREADLRRQQVIEFTEPLVADGRVLPGDRAALESVILHLETSQPIEFAEGEETVSKAPAQVLRDWMSRLKPQIEFGEVVTGEDEENPGLDFQEAPGETVSPERLKLHQKAMSYKAKHNCDYSTAVKAVGGK